MWTTWNMYHGKQPDASGTNFQKRRSEAAQNFNSHTKISPPRIPKVKHKKKGKKRHIRLEMHSLVVRVFGTKKP